MKSLFNLPVVTGCNMYQSENTISFKYEEFEPGRFSFEKIEYNHLLFINIGHMKVFSEGGEVNDIKNWQFLLIPKQWSGHLEVVKPTSLLLFSFDALDKHSQKMLCNGLKSKGILEYNGSDPLPVLPPVIGFIKQMIYYINTGKGCGHLYELKQKELFLLLRKFYQPEELSNLLYPVLAYPDFRTFIIQNYLQVNNVVDLAQLAGMSRTVFDARFKAVFGTSPHQWKLKQIAQKIWYKSMDPEVTIPDLIQEFNFNSATHFNRFCRSFFNCTPGQLIKKHQKR